MTTAAEESVKEIVSTLLSDRGVSTSTLEIIPVTAGAPLVTLGADYFDVKLGVSGVPYGNGVEAYMDSEGFKADVLLLKHSL